MPEAPWLLLIHQIPPKPDYLRVKIWRKLQSLGAIAIKNSVYALPNGEQTHEDFEWVLREIKQGGGDGMVCEVNLVNGLSDQQVRKLFQTTRAKDYAEIVANARELVKLMGKKRGVENRNELLAHVARLKRRLNETENLDFFVAPGRTSAEHLLAKLDLNLRSATSEKRKSQRKKAGIALRNFRGHVWVTRRGIHVDRMASGWLIRRFIDPDAKFKFVATTGYSSLSGEIRFDMFEAEFTHEGDKCTFEVLRDRHGLTDAALVPIGEIVHDIDLKDSKFGRQEACGIARLIAGIAMAYKEDETRLQRGQTVFEDLYQYFSRQREAVLPQE
jgi:hypothetical protein